MTTQTARHTTRSRRSEQGQILVLFALAATALCAMLGLVLDGGDTFAQRRDEQNAADVAALAGANAYLNSTGTVAARQATATSVAAAAAARNGYTQGNGTTVTTSVSLLSSGATVRVSITRPHQNGFARIVGLSSWDVTVDAAAMAGGVDTAVGSAPWIMNVGAFNADGTPKYGKNNPIAFGEGNGDYPTSGTDIAWTDFNGSNNVNAAEARAIIQGTRVVTATMSADQYIGQHNNGAMTTLYDDVQASLAGRDVPVPVTGPCPTGSANTDGCFKGWTMFHVTSATGGSVKKITGYFTGDFTSQPLSVGQCTAAALAAGQCGAVSTNPFDAYVVRLTQ